MTILFHNSSTLKREFVYVIPRYQREYTWGKNQWDTLFNDLLANDPGYFLGSIICINQSTDSLLIPQLELVDGQQRLLTLSLLFASLYDALNNHKMALDDDQRVELTNLKRKLVLKKGDDQIRLIPQIQNNNNSDFLAILSEIKIIDDCETPQWAGNRKIFRAFRYFQGCIEEMTKDRSDRSATIVDFLSKVSQACMVKIEVESHADAYILFESLNNRGIPLTAIDLIKNKLLAKLEILESGKVDYYYDRWIHFLEYLGDDYVVQERFFRQYYNAFKDELKAIHQVPVATRSNLIQIYEKLINHDAKDCLQRISDAGSHYSQILSRSKDDEFNGLDKLFKDLEHIQGAPSYLLLLYLLVRKDDLELTNDHIASIVKILVCFFVRRNLTDIPPTRDLTRLFMKVIDAIRLLSGDVIIRSIEQQLVAVSASDDEFKRKLEGNIYQDNWGATRFILCALSEKGMTRESWVDLWHIEKRHFVWSIEHIFPQGKNIPHCWINMIAEGDEQLAKQFLQTHAHKLGNLTISGFNSTLGNNCFKEKRDRTDKEGRPVGYKNGLVLNEDLALATSWSIKQIDERTEKLVGQVTELFKLDRG